MRARGARGGAGGACCHCGGERGVNAGAGGTGGAARGALLAAALLLYCGAGAALFRALEAPPTAPARPPPAPAELRARCVERLWALTEDLNILYRDNWTALAARELHNFQRALVTSQRAPSPPPASFASSFLYALTLVTTIGPGFAPSSASGKMATALYAAGGMPLVLLYLAAAGATLARLLRRAVAAARRAPPPARAALAPSPARSPFHAALNLRVLRAPPAGAGGDCARVPPLVPLLLLAAYVLLGGVLFRATERWSLAEGCYFSFSSLATIGLGALRPGRGGAGGAAGDAAAAAAAAYILLGIALVAAAFELLRAELRAARRPRSPALPTSTGAAAAEELVAVSLVT